MNTDLDQTLQNTAFELSTMFAYVPQNGRQAYKGLLETYTFEGREHGHNVSQPNFHANK